MANQVVGIGEMRVSVDPGDVLVTYSLGSCVGLAVFDPEAKVGGLLHAMLPLANSNPDKAAAEPCTYTDTGVAELLKAVFALGARKSTLVAKVAGGALLLDDKKLFNIGERNYTVLRKMLWKNGILIAGEDVGGHSARTMYLEMSTGRAWLRSQGREADL